MGELVGVRDGLLLVVPTLADVVEVLDPHVAGRPVEGEDEVGRKQISLVVRIDEDVGERRGGVADVLRARTDMSISVISRLIVVRSRFSLESLFHFAGLVVSTDA